jgi:hypothetical protein
MRIDVAGRPFPTRVLHPTVVVGGSSPAVTLLGLSSAVLYTVSFFLPAYHGAVGYQAFLSAWLFLIGIPMWFANPIFWCGLALLCQGKHGPARKAGVVALVFALSEFWLFLEGLRVGYFVWVGSMGLLTAAAWCGAHDPPRELFLPEFPRVGEAGRIAARFAAVSRGG